MGASALRHTTLLSIAIAILLLARVFEQNLLNAELKPERTFQAPFEEHASWNTTTSTTVTHASARREFFDGPTENTTLISFGDKRTESSSSPDRQDANIPSIPLDQARFALIQKAKRVDLHWIEADDNNRSLHPHRGARGADGNFGYVPDPTALRKNPPPFHFENLTQACAVRDGNYKMLTKNVFVDLTAHKEAEKSGRKRDKIFCLVYTTDQGHAMIPFIRETWGPKCDGFVVGSNKTDESVNAVDIPHEGPELYDNIWQKVRSMWSYVYDNFYDDYDWFHIGGDDLFLIVENLRLYLESEEIRTAANGGMHLPNGNETSQIPLYLGCRRAFGDNRNDVFNSGGSGYTLNKAALKLLVVEGLPAYFADTQLAMEDVIVGRIFRRLDIEPYDTKDEAGGERYMPMSPGFHHDHDKPKPGFWFDGYAIDIKYGLDHCASRSVAFHYIKGDDQKRLYSILFHLCSKKRRLGQKE